MVIRGQVELLLSESLAAESHHRLEEVMRASDRASSLTTQLMAFSRTQTLQSKVLDVNLVIKQMNPLLVPLVSQHIDLSFIPARGTACVRIDASQIEQVIMNLATNARDAMPQGGRLTIEVSNVVYDGEAARSSSAKSANYVLIAVKDTGHGMDEATQSRIFEPFFTTKEPGRGTGLGLSLVYGVVRQNGGQIIVESAQGKGTSFKIYLPHVADPLPESGKKALLNLPKGNETILYAEDEGSVRELVSEYLTSLGYRVLPASDGVNAMQVAQSHPGKIDLLLTDMMMPRLGGRELAEELRKIIPALRVVFVSGYVGHSLVAKNLELPNTYFLPKPFSMQSLAKTIREGLDR
jgi:CheY-like chemotaxis protein/two-component sensor histidine kinase